VGATVGIVGTGELGPTVPVMGTTLGVGTTCAALTPRLPI
jgi:phosphoglycerate dehydrogenase-like enzyme